MGLLQVGPDSAGADPGPACYGRGGQHPTVTDADLLLGYLDPGYFLGGTMALDKAAGEAALRSKVADPLNTAVVAAAFGIHDLINETMAAAAKTHIAEKGGNPNLVTISAFGGAGPVHAYGLARKIGAPRIMVPPLAGVGSALGFFTAPIAFDMSRSHRVALDEADFAAIETLFRDLETEGAAILADAADGREVRYQRTLMMRFVGQGAETDLAIAATPFNEWTKADIRERFDREYRRLYGRTYPETPVEFVTFKVRASLPERPFRLPQLADAAARLSDCCKGERPAYSMLARDFIPFRVYDRMKLFPGASFQGPAIIEEKESTIVVGEDGTVTVDDHGFVWIDLKGGR
jgi:N-methylhydantoinase A